ncbi:Vacuolar protein sorting-associated protein 53 A [Linum perenne]
MLLERVLRMAVAAAIVVAYPMNGGDGVNSYAANSAAQRRAVDAVKEFMTKAISDNLDDILTKPATQMRITDMGCSVGPNTFIAVKTILDSIRDGLGLGSTRVEFQVFLNDHVSNDFNTLFAQSSSHKDSSSSYYLAGVPGSFHDRLFPSSYLHLVHTSYALQWLSQVPTPGLEIKSSREVCYSMGGDEAVAAYRDRFSEDFKRFLSAREQEVVPGGMILVTIPGRSDGTAHSRVTSNVIHNVLGDCLNDLAHKGKISQEKVDKFNIPIYFASPQELRLVVESNRGFTLEILECVEHERGHGTAESKAKVILSHVRAGLEVFLRVHFEKNDGDDDEDRSVSFSMDEVFESFETKLLSCGFFEDGGSGSAFTLFAALKQLAFSAPKMDKSSALEYINQMFPTEASLSGVEPLMQKIHSEIRRVDAGILAAVRQQSNSRTKAKEDLAAATGAVEELMFKIREIKTKAEQSETMVQEICRDIKKLDFAKKHITTTITALHRLTMLVSAVEQLQVMASKRNYKEAAAQLEAVNQLCSHFEAYRDIPKIMELREKFKNIKQILKSHVFSDFSSLGTGKETEETNLLQQLSDACLVVDALEPSVREELVNNFCSRELTSYEQIFEGAELAKLDKTERRYAWIKRRIRTNEEIWKIFPLSWHVPYRLCIQFCKKTRKQLEGILENLKDKPDVGALLLALQRTLEFEDELAEKFGGGSQKEIGNEIEEIGRENNSQNVSDIRKKYERKLAVHEENEGNFNFRGIISSCFEPHLTSYVELEQKTLMENLEKLVQEEKWDIEEGSQNNVLSSSMQLFLIIKRSLKRCSALTKSQTLLNLFRVFEKILKAYAAKLKARLPKGGVGIVAAATGMDGQIKTSDRDERVICYIVNSAEYCRKTSGELAESVSRIIDPQLVAGADMSAVEEEFSGLITDALMTLVHGLETKFDVEMAAMTRVPWATLESVGDQSGYVNGINMILTSSTPVLGSLLAPVHFQYFLDKLASSLGPRFYTNIFKCKQISETGAQQMLLDTQAVKTILLEIPVLGRQMSSASSYSKFVSREMSKAEALLKVILSPVDSVADTYRALLPEGTPMEFQRILELKGLKKADQQTILDDFNKQSPPVSQPPILPSTSAPASAVTTTPAPATTTTAAASATSLILNPSLGLSATSREDVLARAAALGRGAATTGFKRFLALTEAAKDRKDGPFRKLFHA